MWGEANWELAARFAPYRMSDLVSSTSVQPRWIEDTDNFWYRYETAEGADFILVEPALGRKRPIFDNDRIAAELTRITRDPYDGKHLPITSVRFIDADTIQIDVESPQDAPPTPEAEQEDDMEEQEQQQGDQGRERAEKLVHHFEYDIDTQTLRTLDDYEEAEEEVAVTEIQLTDDGVEHYSYHSGFRGQTDNEKEEEKGKRQGAGITWAHDGSRFALTRSDQREVGDCGSSTRSATTGPSSSRTSTSCPARRTSRSRSCWCSNGGEVRARIAEMQKNLVR